MRTLFGLHKEAQKINIQIEGKFFNLPSLTVQLTTRVANKEPGANSAPPVQFSVGRRHRKSAATKRNLSVTNPPIVDDVIAGAEFTLLLA